MKGLILSSFFLVLLLSAIARDSDLPRGPDDRGAEYGEPMLVSADFTPNRFSGIPNDTIQLVAWYDGSERFLPSLHIEYQDVGSKKRKWLKIRKLPASSHNEDGTEVFTGEFAVPGCNLTGRFRIVGAKPDGVIDGVAFGLLWKDESGAYHRVQSNSHRPDEGASYIGMWPVEMYAAHFYEMAPELTTGHARNQAMSLIWGARLLPDGTYDLPLN